MTGEPTITDMMVAYAADAVDHARLQEIDLDYSAESVRRVELILGRMYESRPRGMLAKLLRRGPSERDVDTFCKMYGAYLGEVLRRRRGGEWRITTVAGTEGVLTLEMGETSAFPPSKVHKRLTNGPEDDVWPYFRVLDQHR